MEAEPAVRGAGFTLLEVLVATIIAAFAVAVLFNTDLTGLTASHVAATTTEAASVARSELARLGRTIPLTPGMRRGRDKEGFRWHLAIRLAGVAGSLRLYRVDLTVTWRGAGHRRHRLELATARLAPP